MEKSNHFIDILVTLNENYMDPLKVMLTSLHHNNLEEEFRIWVVHESIGQEKMAELENLTHYFGWELHNKQIEHRWLDEAPTIKRYPKEMYFRLLCGEILPEEVNKVIYLDPDILIINSIRKLWDTDLGGHMIAASTHTGTTNLTSEINKLRLGTDHEYFNSGVMVMDLTIARTKIKLEDIIAVIEKHGAELLLPDQDVLNLLYGKHIKEVPEEIWNYDTRKAVSYYARSLGKHDLQWVMDNTVILHFCGQPKPWDPKSDSRFTALYLHYGQFLKRLEKQF
ncbi:glycosyltransferase family 8 protein [Vagococcus elongatus]|uniref:Glycosyl transferase n=1 Tax=Vagococcus elongatus TaxID=180344 RepID=A0A430AN25_9ENTE|nr:glycosyltransferase family 8 protein [Vagococcus elongatus]RSU09560.1 glycosyl transferase [Vagococcus elongatus]